MAAKKTESIKLPGTTPAPAFTKQVEAVEEITEPAELGTAIDLVRSVQQLRIAAEKMTERLKKKQTALEEHILGLLASQKADSASGRLATVSRSPKAIAEDIDWDTFFEFIAKKKRFDLIQRRLAIGAARDMWEEGVAIPGVKRGSKMELSIHAKGAGR